MEPRRHEDTKKTAIRLPAFLVLRAFVSSWFIFTAASPRGAEPAPVGENVAEAKGLDAALKKLHAPLRETEPLPPAEQLKRFEPRAGLAVDLIASEPAVRQPLHLAFDERGRMWVTQYVQYPFPAGLKVVEYDQYIRAKFDKVPPAPPKQFQGNDLISIHADADGDGTFESRNTFVEGLSIATAALPGRGGVWVMNPPYLLFYPDADRDDVPDGDPVVHLSGFGLEDTHAVANSLTWGPDGWIYGAQGSTCTAKVRVEIQIPQSKIQNRTTDFLGQCVWRYHPTRHVFEIFAEGGGNTFGVEFDDAGRLYSGTNWGKYRGLHFAQGGYYVKGWGKHGPLTNPHAYGFFEHMPHEGNADRLVHTFVVYGGGLLGEAYDGKIIGPSSLQSRVHVTRLEPAGSTFRTVEEPFLLTCDDGWFRPVDLKTGPDGALYLADFYERRISHVDPRDNWHRASGRLWRVRPAGWKPGVKPFDLSKASSEDLVALLRHENRWHRATARRLLGDRRDATVAAALRELIVSGTGRAAFEALWALNEVGAFDEATAAACLAHGEPAVREWAVRLLGDAKQALSPDLLRRMLDRAAEEVDPHVRSQLASTAKRLPGEQALALLDALERLDADAADPHIPLLLWWAAEDKAVSHRGRRGAAVREPGGVATPSRARRSSRASPGDTRRTPRRRTRPLVKLLDAAPGAAERDILFGGVKQAFAGRAITNLSPALAAALGDVGRPGDRGSAPVTRPRWRRR